MIINFKTPISPAIGLKAGVTGAMVGIELEYEECDSHSINMTKMRPYWRIDIDHSLRNGGIEFISKPLDEVRLPKALAVAQEELRTAGGVANKRCGVHIHLNVSDLTFGEVWKITTYYALTEAFIFKQFADGREENHFCVPLFSNTVLQQNFYTDANSLHRGVHKHTKKPAPSAIFADGSIPKGLVPLHILDTPKYSAMNTGSLMKFGTLEFRQMRGTRDLDIVWEWAKFLINLRNVALRYESAEHILQEYEDNGFERLCADIGLNPQYSVPAEDLNDCVDGAFMMVGHEPTKYTELNWEL